MLTPPDGTVYQLMVLPAEIAFKFELLPAQMIEGEAVTGVGAGVTFTVIVIELVLVHPEALVPVTVYVVVANGLNATPSVTPPLHT